MVSRKSILFAIGAGLLFSVSAIANAAEAPFSLNSIQVRGDGCDGRGEGVVAGEAVALDLKGVTLKAQGEKGVSRKCAVEARLVVSKGFKVIPEYAIFTAETSLQNAVRSNASSSIKLNGESVVGDSRALRPGSDNWKYSHRAQEIMLDACKAPVTATLSGNITANVVGPKAELKVRNLSHMLSFKVLPCK